MHTHSAPDLIALIIDSFCFSLWPGPISAIGLSSASQPQWIGSCNCCVSEAADLTELQAERIKRCAVGVIKCVWMPLYYVITFPNTTDVNCHHWWRIWASFYCVVLLERVLCSVVLYVYYYWLNNDLPNTRRLDLSPKVMATERRFEGSNICDSPSKYTPYWNLIIKWLSK